jgi:hypothetical protein
MFRRKEEIQLKVRWSEREDDDAEVHSVGSDADVKSTSFVNAKPVHTGFAVNRKLTMKKQKSGP